MTMKGGILREVALLGWLRQWLRSDVALKTWRPVAVSANLMLWTRVSGDPVMVKSSVGMIQQPENQAKEAAVQVTRAMSKATAVSKVTAVRAT
jgi:hypothetical protein